MAILDHPYLIFELDLSVTNLKTKVVIVRSARHGNVLGLIRWFGRWRQYTFWPRPNTTFNPACLAEINGTIRDLMGERANRG
jgi:hypothetical protein